MPLHSTVQELVCVHCRKAFQAEVLSAHTKQAGFKCPHCRLFMPLGRVEANDARPSS